MWFWLASLLLGRASCLLFCVCIASFWLGVCYVGVPFECYFMFGLLCLWFESFGGLLVTVVCITCVACCF